MTIRLKSIVKNFLDMTETEKRHLILKIRHNKYVLRPAMVQKKTKKVKKAATKKASVRTAKVKKLIQDLTPAQKQAILDRLKSTK